jgi:protein-tyrosine phosphatase
MTEVLDWQTAARPHTVVRQAVRALARGDLVAFPTETVYGVAAHALVPEAVERLRHGKGRPVEKPLTLALRGSAEAFDWAPEISPLARRLARRCWPGPMTLVLDAGVERGLASRLPRSVRQLVCPGASVGLRVPAHRAILAALQQLPGPLVLSSANRSGEPAATRAEEVVQALGDDLALVIDDGPSPFGKASTVVQVKGSRWEILREGVLAASDIERQAACLILFVCTGNTCRSPLAEVLCKKLLADRLGCTPAELPRRGFLVHSAGLAAMMGQGAAPEAVEAARELGADLTGHRSRPLTASLAAQSDYLLAMTQGHIEALTAHFPQAGPQVRLLSPQGEDLPDPIGCDAQVYRECAQHIVRHLEQLLPQWQP